MVVKKKRIISYVFIILTGLILLSGSMAFFTDRVEVQNITTTIPEIKITVDESKVNEFGVKTADNKKVKENTYTLIPGYRYVKDPVIHVAENSYECYVFAEINNEIKNIESETDSIHGQMLQNGWIPVSGTENVYYYSEIAKAGMDLPLFHYFKVDGNKVVASSTPENEIKDSEYYLEDYQGKNIHIKVYASQVVGFVDQTDSWFVNFASI